jgi:DNA-binding Lrp family transcriptional regulator
LLTDSEFTEVIIKDLRDMIEVVESHIIYGDWDLIIKVRIPALSDLTKLVMRLRKMQGIKKTSTLITLAS